jgi:hypothetical protein
MSPEETGIGAAIIEADRTGNHYRAAPKVRPDDAKFLSSKAMGKKSPRRPE